MKNEKTDKETIIQQIRTQLIELENSEVHSTDRKIAIVQEALKVIQNGNKN